MKTFVVSISFFSEPNFSGNCSKYYLVWRSGNKVSYSGITNAKRYVIKAYAEKAAAKLRETFPTAKIEVEER